MASRVLNSYSTGTGLGDLSMRPYRNVASTNAKIVGQSEACCSLKALIGGVTSPLRQHANERGQTRVFSQKEDANEYNCDANGFWRRRWVIAAFTPVGAGKRLGWKMARRTTDGSSSSAM